MKNECPGVYCRCKNWETCPRRHFEKCTQHNPNAPGYVGDTPIDVLKLAHKKKPVDPIEVTIAVHDIRISRVTFEKTVELVVIVNGSEEMIVCHGNRPYTFKV